MRRIDEVIFSFIKAKFSSIAIATVANFNAEKGKKNESKLSSYLIPIPKITIGNSEVIKIPGPNQLCAQLLERANVKLPEILPDKEVIVATQKKLQSGRK